MAGTVRRWWVYGAVVAGAAVLAGGLLWWWWPAKSVPAPRAREYRDVNVCLLTDAQGVAGTATQPVWAGLQDASLATRVRASYLQSTGGTVAQVLPYLTSLVQRQCTVVVAVGRAQIGAVAQDAPRFPKVRFVVVGSGATGGNVTTLPSDSAAQVRTRVDATVTGMVDR